MNDWTHIDVPVRLIAEFVVMRPYQIRRDIRRNGRTSEAAARLAAYRLRTLMARSGKIKVDDIAITRRPLFDVSCHRVVVTAFVPCVDVNKLDGHKIPDGYKITRGATVIRIAKPPAKATA